MTLRTIDAPYAVPDLAHPGYFLPGPYTRPDPANPGYYLFVPPAIWSPDATVEDVLTGDRITRYTYELVSRDGATFGDGTRFTGGSLEWTANAAVKGRGTLTYVGDDNAVDWLNARVRITAHVTTATGNGETSWGLGVWIPSVPVWDYGNDGPTASVEILGKETILDQARTPYTYSLEVGANVTDAIRAIITAQGESAGALTDSDAVLRTARSWEPGTVWLTIINDLLDSMNYLSLWADGAGQYRIEPNVDAAAREITRQFVAGSTAIHESEFTREQDVYAIPNRQLATSQSTGDEPALTSVATNEDATSPYSYAARGRWIDAEPLTGVEVVDQAALDARARQQLALLTSATATVDIAHAPVPLRVNQAVWFRPSTASIDARHVVTKTSLPLDPLALAASTLREVVL